MLFTWLRWLSFLDKQNSSLKCHNYDPIPSPCKQLKGTNQHSRSAQHGCPWVRTGSPPPCPVPVRRPCSLCARTASASPSSTGSYRPRSYHTGVAPTSPRFACTVRSNRHIQLPIKRPNKDCNIIEKDQGKLWQNKSWSFNVEWNPDSELNNLLQWTFPFMPKIWFWDCNILPNQVSGLSIEIGISITKWIQKHPFLQF